MGRRANGKRALALKRVAPTGAATASTGLQERRMTSTASWQRRAVGNVAFSAIAQIASKVSTFAWTAVAARELSQRDFGAFNFALSLGLLLASVAEWGFDTALVQRGSAEPEKISKPYTLAMASEAIVAIPMFAVAGAIAFGALDGDAARLTLIFVLVATLVDAFSDTIRAGASAVQRQGLVSTALTVGRLLTAMLAIPLLLLGAGVLGLAAALLVSYVFALLAHVFAARRLGLRLVPAEVSVASLRRFVSGTTTIGVSALVLAALFRLDTVMLAAISGERAVASYSTAYKLFDTVLFVTFAIAGALFPVMSERGDDRRHISEIVVTGLTAQAALYVPFAVICLMRAPEVLNLFFGPTYSQISAGALRWLSPAPLIFSATYLLASALTAVRRTKGMLVASVAATLVNIAGNLVLIPHYRGTGAALMTTVGYGIDSILLWLFYRRVGCRMPGLAQRLLPTLLAGGALAVAIAALPLPVAPAVGVGLLGYGIMWLLLMQWWQPGDLTSLRRFMTPRTG